METWLTYHRQTKIAHAQDKKNNNKNKKTKVHIPIRQQNCIYLGAQEDNSLNFVLATTHKNLDFKQINIFESLRGIQNGPRKKSEIIIIFSYFLQSKI